MDKRQSVIESIQKLLALNVSDDEIAENLSDVGISKEDAVSMIAQAKGAKTQTPSASQTPLEDNSASVQSVQKPASAPVDKPARVIFGEDGKKLSMNEEVISQIPFVKQAGAKPADKPAVAANEDVAGRIILDVAKQSNPEEVGEDIKEEENEEESAQVIEGESESVSAGESKKAESVNDEESEDEFEAKVKQALASAKKQVSAKQDLQKPKSQFSDLNNYQSVSAKEGAVFNKPSPASFEASPDFEELWKKGIVVAVNAKLAEMKQLKDDVDSEIAQKVDEAVRKEMYQSKVLLDSQKELLISSNKEALEQKQKEITFIIDAKIAELKQYNKQISDNLKSMEEIKKQQEASMNEIRSSLEEAKKTKSQLLIEVNSEMIKTKSQAQAFLDSASAQLAQMDQRVNKTLELEKNIAEGMLATAEQKIEQLAIARADELIERMEVELNKLEATNKQISPALLDEKMKTIEKFRTEFIENMQAGLAQINSAIEELNRKNALAQETLEEKTLAIDAKMEELTKFEKQFTQIMDNVLSKQ